jgi:hypothetical protein
MQAALNTTSNDRGITLMVRPVYITVLPSTFTSSEYSLDINLLSTISFNIIGRDKAQAVSRRLPTAAALVRSQVWLCGICGGQSGTGAVSSANSHSENCSAFINRRYYAALVSNQTKG